MRFLPSESKHFYTMKIIFPDLTFSSPCILGKKKNLQQLLAYRAQQQHNRTLQHTPTSNSAITNPYEIIFGNFIARH